MDIIASLGTDVPETVGPTYEAYGDIFRIPANASIIHDTKSTTVKYGPHPRNVLDLYEPEPTTPEPVPGSPRPILIYLYGGAFVFGDRILSEIPGALVYRNLASFYASRLGYSVIVMDYRLVKDGARYPSGGEDLDMALRWTLDHFADRRDLFLMGHSAGGSHIATWLFNRRFKATRDRLIVGDICGGSDQQQQLQPSRLKLRGTIFLSTPLSLTPDLERLFQPYYGAPPQSRAGHPISLVREILGQQVSEIPVALWPPMLVLVADMDPDSVHDAAADFSGTWQGAGGQVEARVLKRHNHHSPPISLGTQNEEEEAWGYMVGVWMKGCVCKL